MVSPPRILGRTVVAAFAASGGSLLTSCGNGGGAEIATEGPRDGEGSAGAESGDGGTPGAGAVAGNGGERAMGGAGTPGSAENPAAAGAGGSAGSGGRPVNGSSGSAGIAGSPAGSGGSSTSAGSAGASGAPASGGSNGSAGAAAVDPRCPTSLLTPFPPGGSVPVACAEDGLRCDFQLACNSGPQVLTITCQGETWDAWDGPRGCDLPYDYCPSTTGANGAEPSVYCKDGQWDVESGASLTAFGGACPSEPPEVGSPCYVVGGTGGGPDREPCGYFCPDAPETWTVLECDNPGGDEPLNAGLMGLWTSDGACD